MLLSIDEVSFRAGGLEILEEVNLGIEAGRITALIGPNGAGKTTLFNVVSGHAAGATGGVRFDNRSLLGSRPHSIARLGLGRTFQTPRLFERMSVVENLLVSASNQVGESLVGVWLRPKAVRDQENALLEQAWETVDFLELGRVANDLAATLSGGQKKLLELGRALMLRPKLVLLDEPVAGVTPALRRSIGDKLGHLIEEGLTFLVIEHDMEFVMQHAKQVFVLASGRVISEGPPASVREDPTVLEAYMGAGTAQ